MYPAAQVHAPAMPVYPTLAVQEAMSVHMTPLPGEVLYFPDGHIVQPLRVLLVAPTVTLPLTYIETNKIFASNHLKFNICLYN